MSTPLHQKVGMGYALAHACARTHKVQRFEAAEMAQGQCQGCHTRRANSLHGKVEHPQSRRKAQPFRKLHHECVLQIAICRCACLERESFERNTETGTQEQRYPDGRTCQRQGCQSGKARQSVRQQRRVATETRIVCITPKSPLNRR